MSLFGSGNGEFERIRNTELADDNQCRAFL